MCDRTTVKAHNAMERPSLSLLLYHGRDTADEAMSDFGYNGPTIRGIRLLSQMYDDRLLLVFEDAAALKEAKEATGWETYDHETLVLPVDAAGLVKVTAPGGKVSHYGARDFFVGCREVRT